MDYRLIGSILLIVGTSIGAGMLALPVATAEFGLLPSLALLVACWAIMLVAALLLLEVNLWLPQESNLVSMARATLGRYGAAITWIVYLLLLYSLLCAYIAGGSDLFQMLLSTVFNVKSSLSFAAIGFTALLGTVVYFGIRTVDYVNRSLMVIKLGSYCLLVYWLAPFISRSNLVYQPTGGPAAMGSTVALTVTMTAFGFAPLIPSLRVYFAGQVAKLKRAIIIGSLIPLICYIAWDIAIMGIVPATGQHGLVAILHHGQSTSLLMDQVTATTGRHMITMMFKLFTPICLVTSFLGVALCLFDFLSDGLHLTQQGRGGRLIVYGLTFLPPIGIVLFWPHIFISALQYAGINCILLAILLPTLMIWQGRKLYPSEAYYTPIGRVTLCALMGVSLAIILNSMIQ